MPTPPSDYERYLRVPELLALQKPAESRTHPEELLFQTIHQVEELWFKLAIDDLGRTVTALGAGDLGEAAYLLDRVVSLTMLMRTQLHVIEKLPPNAYWAIRKGLGHGSGQESPGFNGMMAAFAPVGRAFRDHLAKQPFDLLALYRDPSTDRALFALAERLVDLDQAFQGFRYHHLMLVKRIIGEGTPSLKGKPTELLERSMKTAFFPELWQVREALFADFTPGKLAT